MIADKSFQVGHSPVVLMQYSDALMVTFGSNEPIIPYHFSHYGINANKF